MGALSVKGRRGKGRAAIPLEVPGTWLNAPLGNAITSEERDWLRLGYIT